MRQSDYDYVQVVLVQSVVFAMGTAGAVTLLGLAGYGCVVGRIAPDSDSKLRIETSPHEHVDRVVTSGLFETSL